MPTPSSGSKPCHNCRFIPPFSSHLHGGPPTIPHHGVHFLAVRSDLKIVRLKLKRVKVHPLPRITVDISMLLTLRVHNADVYSMDFGAVDVAVSYRGKELGARDLGTWAREG
ncbi:late embryogenesis abundant protein [Sesbania bispinosa]|nr:late embryogenesis abundant protein [Sesbania bispinosa]